MSICVTVSAITGSVMSMSSPSWLGFARERRSDRVHVVDAAAPCAAARLLEQRPEPRVLGQVLVGREVRAWRPARKHAGALLGPEDVFAVAHQVDGALEAVPVHDDADQVALENAADGPARQRLGPDVADAGARGDAGEARVRDHRHFLAPREMLERGCDLVDLLHPRAQGPAADQNQDVARLETARALALDGRDGVALAREDARGSGLAVDAVGIHHRGIDGGALDHRALGRQVAAGKRDGAGEPGLARLL